MLPNLFGLLHFTEKKQFENKSYFKKGSKYLKHSSFLLLICEKNNSNNKIKNMRTSSEVLWRWQTGRVTFLSDEKKQKKQTSKLFREFVLQQTRWTG